MFKVVMTNPEYRGDLKDFMESSENNKNNGWVQNNPPDVVLSFNYCS